MIAMVGCKIFFPFRIYRKSVLQSGHFGTSVLVCVESVPHVCQIELAYQSMVDHATLERKISGLAKCWYVISFLAILSFCYCMKEILFPERMFASNILIYNFNSWKGAHVLLSCIQTSVKGDYPYDLFHPCRGGVAKIYVAVNDTSTLGFCRELNGSLFSGLFSWCMLRKNSATWYFDTNRNNNVTYKFHWGQLKMFQLFLK